MYTDWLRTRSSGDRAGGAGWPWLPRALLLGLALIAIWWPIAWVGPRPLADYAFFPLWLGFIFTLDGLVRVRSGTSLLARDGWRCLFLFVASVALWWIFEALNRVVGNWHYLAPRHYSTLEYVAIASLDFSTVIPAVLTAAELVRSFGADPPRGLPAVRQSRRFLLGAHLAGWCMLVAVLLAPNVAFPFLWLSLIFILDPLVTWLGGRSIGRYLERGDWSPVAHLALAGLLCGWCWEMWNFYSMPKWWYSVPHVGFWHVFEMPLLGYSGYLPFGVEVYIFYTLVATLLARFPFPRTRVSNDDLANVRGGRVIESPEAGRL